MNLLLDGGVDLGIGKASYEDDHSKTVVLFGIGVKPGVSFNLTENFSLVAHFGFLGYLTDKSERQLTQKKTAPE